VIIALAIMTVAFASILLTESASVRATERARAMTTITMLAKTLVTQTEMKMEEGEFSVLKEEETGNFPAPNENFSWRRVVKEVKFPNLGGQKREGVEGGDMAEKIFQLITQFLSKSLREVTITVIDKDAGNREQSVSFYWVNLNNEFQLSL
jgi:predicted kinase